MSCFSNLKGPERSGMTKNSIFIIIIFLLFKYLGMSYNWSNRKNPKILAVRTVKVEPPKTMIPAKAKFITKLSLNADFLQSFAPITCQQVKWFKCFFLFLMNKIKFSTNYASNWKYIFSNDNKKICSIFMNFKFFFTYIALFYLFQM